MITRKVLAELLESLGEEHVLSVYLASEATDPAARRSWHVRLKNRTRDERDRLKQEAPDQLPSFDLAVAHVEDALSVFTGFLPERGWVGFATPAGLHLADTLPVPPPELLAWDVGPRLAPYVRNLKLRRPIVAVLIDSRSAKLFRSVNGEVEEIDTFSGHYRMNDVSKGTRKTASTTTGVRGETKSDSATRSLGAEIERMWTEVINTVVDVAGRDSYVVFGGPAGHIGSFRASLHDELHHRSVEVPTLHVDSSAAELEDALQAAATDMTSRRQEALLEGLIQKAGGGDHAALGPKATEVHLEHGAVSTLLLSRDFLVREPRDAERLVRLAIQTGSGIEEVGGDPGARLDREAGGVGAGLRFNVGEVGA
jgi:hypothetical protein